MTIFIWAAIIVFGLPAAFKLLAALCCWINDLGIERLQREMGNAAFAARYPGATSDDPQFLGHGLAEVWDNAVSVAAFLWARFVVATLWLWLRARAWLPKKPQMHPDTVTTLAQLNDGVQGMDAKDEARTAMVASALISTQNRIGVLAQRGADRTRDESHEFVMLGRALREHENAVAMVRPAPQGLLGGVVGAGLGKYALIAGAAALGFGALQTARLEHAKGDLKEAKADRDEARRSVGLYNKRVGELRETVKDLGVKCETESREAADRRAAQEARARTAAQRARIKLNEAAANLGVGEPFDLNRRLRDLAPPTDAGTAPAEGVAIGVSGNPSADSAPASGGEPTSR